MALFTRRVLTAIFAWTVWLPLSAATFNGVKYSDSSDIEPGRWTSQFLKAKTYAYKKHVPMIVVWVNPSCGYCTTFERNVMASSSVGAWLKKRSYVGVIAINTVTPDADSAYSFIGGVSKYPKCMVYWNPDSGPEVRYSFTGRSMSASTFMDTVDAKLGSKDGTQEKTYKLTLAVSPNAGGTLTGAGAYAVGKRVTLRAKPAKKYVFIGWYDGDERLSESKSFGYVMPKKAKKLTARFVMEKEDEAAVSAAVNGITFDSAVTRRKADLICGVAVSWPVSAQGLTKTAASISGLPSGLKYSAKTGLITGVPSRAQAKAVTIVAKTASGTKVSYVLDVNVQALPIWASGTYDGGGEEGVLSLSVSSAGKISGKYMSQGTTWILSASSYASYDAENNVFNAEVLQKYGKVVHTNLVTVTGNEESLLGMVTCERFTGWWNGWKNPAVANVSKVIDKATNLTCQVLSPVPGMITLSFGRSGTIKAKGSFVVGKNVRTGKVVKHSTSCSTVLCQQEESGCFLVYIYFKPKKNVFDGLVGCLRVSFDGKNIFF